VGVGCSRAGGASRVGGGTGPGAGQRGRAGGHYQLRHPSHQRGARHPRRRHRGGRRLGRRGRGDRTRGHHRACRPGEPARSVPFTGGKRHPEPPLRGRAGALFSRERAGALRRLLRRGGGGLGAHSGNGRRGCGHGRSGPPLVVGRLGVGPARPFRSPRGRGRGLSAGDRVAGGHADPMRGSPRGGDGGVGGSPSGDRLCRIHRWRPAQGSGGQCRRLRGAARPARGGGGGGHRRRDAARLVDRLGRRPDSVRQRLPPPGGGRLAAGRSRTEQPSPGAGEPGSGDGGGRLPRSGLWGIQRVVRRRGRHAAHRHLPARRPGSRRERGHLLRPRCGRRGVHRHHGSRGGHGVRLHGEGRRGRDGGRRLDRHPPPDTHRPGTAGGGLCGGRDRCLRRWGRSRGSGRCERRPR
jgi:hypothetical protein